jgi:polyisoprenyl-teichoic acid--peptidoglycan teichoic acid transferase
MNNANQIKKMKKVILIISVSLLGIVLLMAATFYVVRATGKHKLFKAQNEEQLDQLQTAMEQGPALEKDYQETEETEIENTEEVVTKTPTVIEDKTEVVEEDRDEKEVVAKKEKNNSPIIKYNNKTYQFNDGVMSFLFMGIDQPGEVAPAKDGISGGQSDTMFLLVLNPDTKQISVVGINRDTIADIDMYDRAGNFLMTDKRQITLQHGYGDGMHQSCQRAVDAVSKLFYYIPINGYCSLNIGAVAKLNDAVGGVDVVTPNKIEIYGVTYEAGQAINLQGETAKWFLQTRDVYAFNSAGARLERQKTYLTAYIKKAMTKTKEDLGFPLDVYSILSKYMVTNVSADSILYLATEAAGYSFSGTQVHSLQGQTIRGSMFEEFYPDQQALYDLVIRLFYEEVTE